jgi:hypothetical protein
MKSIDVVLSPAGVEDPLVHIVSINDTPFNIAIQLKGIVLLGEPSGGSEYRKFNLDIEAVVDILDPNNKKSIVQLIKSAICSDAGDIASGNYSVKNIAYSGVDYCILYYLISNQYPDDACSPMVANMVSVFDKLIRTAKIQIDEKQISQTIERLINIQNTSSVIESRMLAINRNQIKNISDLSQTIWKEMYIHRILRGVGSQSILQPSIDWAVVRGVNKYLFTNAAVIADVTMGETIQYIQATARKQMELSAELSLGDIGEYSNKLNESTRGLDYTLGDIALIIFNIRRGPSIKEKAKDTSSSIISNLDSFKRVVLQYLHGVSVLARHGIIHNDPSLNNIIDIGTSVEPFECRLSNGATISIDTPSCNLALVNYTKSILSKEHGAGFDTHKSKIKDELNIVFSSPDRELVDCDDQIFNCYVMYDVVRFGLSMIQLLDRFDSNKIAQQRKFIHDLITHATQVLSNIYDRSDSFQFNVTEPQGSIEWLISKLYEPYVKEGASVHIYRPSFSSTMRNRADALKYEYISQYVSHRMIS